MKLHYIHSIDQLIKAFKVTLDTGLPDPNTYPHSRYIQAVPTRNFPPAIFQQEDIDVAEPAYSKEEYVKEMMMVHGKPFWTWVKL